MNTLDDLRSTLDRHAEDLHDTERYIRPVAVRARIRAVRRRRTVAVAAATALVLVLVASVATITSLHSPGTPQPASVVGVDVPRSVDVLGFPYDLSDLEELGDGARRLGEADQDRAVTLVADGLGSGSATLYSGDQAVARVRGTEQTASPVPVGDAETDLRVELDGADPGARAGVAVYEATGELAPGVTNPDKTSVFRDEVAGNPLIAAAFSKPGDHAVRLEASGADDQMRYVLYCTGDDDLYVNVDVDGAGAYSSSCSGEPRRDAGVGTSATADGPAVARAHDVRVYLTRADDDTEVAPDGVEFGVGIYQRSSLDQEVAGQRIDARVEYLGRTWELAGSRRAPATIDTADGDVLLGFAAKGKDVSLEWDGRLSDGGDGMVTLGDGGASATAGLLLAGDSYTVRLTGDVTDGALLVYRPE